MEYLDIGEILLEAKLSKYKILKKTLLGDKDEKK